MVSPLVELFEDKEVVDRIEKRLPYMFQIAELESSRAGKIGMEVGTIREQIVIALLIYKFGNENVEREIPITETQVDVKVLSHALSIKTITGKTIKGVKLVWTVDPKKAREFYENYDPSCDILLVQVNWGGVGGFYHIPLDTQRKIFRHIGRERYITLPKPGTNPRGVELSKEAVHMFLEDDNTRRILISWTKRDINFDPYKRWVDMWKEASHAF